MSQKYYRIKTKLFDSKNTFKPGDICPQCQDYILQEEFDILPNGLGMQVLFCMACEETIAASAELIVLANLPQAFLEPLR